MHTSQDNQEPLWQEAKFNHPDYKQSIELWRKYQNNEITYQEFQDRMKEIAGE